MWLARAHLRQVGSERDLDARGQVFDPRSCPQIAVAIRRIARVLVLVAVTRQALLEASQSDGGPEDGPTIQ